MAFSGNIVAGGKVGHARADLFDIATIFVAHRHGHGNGFLGPRVPVPDVEVGSTDCGLGNPNEDIHGADLGHRDVEEFQAGFGAGFYEGTHSGV
jgi:hypothetical protein